MSLAHKINVTEAVRKFSEIVNRIYYKGDRYTLTRGNKAVVSMEPVLPITPFKISELANLLSTLPSLSKKENLNFENDIKKGLKTLKPPQTEWDS